MSNEKSHSLFEDEFFFSLRRQRDSWAKITLGLAALSTLSLVALVLVLPLKEIRPYVVLVDKTTGEAEKVVQVRPASIEQQDAVLQAEIVSYVSDRETYDKADSVERITDVLTRSFDQAAESLKSEWTASSPTYPPTLYKEDRVLVTIKSISVTRPAVNGAEGVVAVRIVKRRETNGRTVIARPYVVTVNHKFEPDVNAKLETVWKNPLGFKVVGYRVDAETISPDGK